MKTIPREHRCFNQDYRFHLGDVADAESASFNDNSWIPVGLPHSFSIPYWREATFYTGYGWYRKQFTIEDKLLDKKLYLEFEGVFQHAELFINGQLTGDHKGGYTGFIIDISNFIHAGSNTLAVRVNNKWSPELAPRAGEHVFCGGIYRNVNLIITNPLHIDWHGTFVTTPDVSRDSARINVKTEIRNDFKTSRKCMIKSSVIDPDGKIITEMESKKEVNAGTVVVIEHTSDVIKKPQLWHVDTPRMYHLQTSVYDDGQLVDSYDTPFGIRWFEFTADKGFFLNGEPLYLQGANVHQDHAGWGDAVTDAGHYRDVAMIKECGMNFIRGSHYPHAPAFADACDQLGILFWSESVFWGIGGFQKDQPWRVSAYPEEKDHQPGFEASCHQALREMIRINRNHPSIITWSMGNEPFFTAPEAMNRARKFAQELAHRSQELDTSRPSSMGGVQREGFDRAAQLAGYNGDGARLYLNPGFPNLVAEYGSYVSDRPGIYDPCRGSLQDKRFQWRSGECIWCGFDHGSIAGDMGKMGMIDYFRLPKRTWYWYRKQLCGTEPPTWPQVGIPAYLTLTATSNKIKANGHDDTHLIVSVCDTSGREIANEIAITLQIESGPGRFPTGRSIEFKPKTDIAIIEGKAAIEFRSYHGGKTVIRALADGVKGATITITSLADQAYDERDLAIAALYNTQYSKGKSEKQKPETSCREIAAQRPTRASSEAAGHHSHFANNRSAGTCWKAAGRDSPSWWQVDLEGFYRIVDVKIEAQHAKSHLVVTSEDGTTWRPWDKVEELRLSRFLRVEFNPCETSFPELQDIEIYGIEAD